MDQNEVENLRLIYNQDHRGQPPIPKGGIKETWNAIRKRLHTTCDSCIIASMLHQPTAPKAWETNPEEWLSSVDIDNVEREYTRLFKNYKYIGTLPIDFDKMSNTGTCLINSICSLNINDIYKKGKTQIGIVFNTDVSSGPGQHWIAIFCDLRPELKYPRFTYFDSYASKPEPEIQRLMQRWKAQWDSKNSRKMFLSYNKTRHQYEDSECGMYCLYFHYCCLTGIPMKRRIPDEVVRGFRGLLFRVSKK